VDGPVDSGQSEGNQMSPEAIELLTEILEGTASLPGALCADWPLVYEATTDATEPDQHDYAVATAIRLCKTCPAFDRCRAWLDSLPPPERPPGVTAARINRRTT
jgi:WhiB family transcriptional regulator, redox-sensing transcriptional regulator